MSAARAIPFPLPPVFPTGVNPETYRMEAVHAALREAAYLMMLTVPDASRPNVPILSGGNMVGVQVNEQPHRFDIRPAEPTLQRGLRAANLAGEPVARVSIRWMVCPEKFDAAPGKVPPPTPLNPFCSQRFVMLDGVFEFDDRRRSAIHAFGQGRTYPKFINGRPQLFLGAVISSLSCTGKLEGLVATNVVCGVIQPPSGLLLNFIWRIVDPSRRLRTDTVRPVRQIQDPAPGVTSIAVLGETEPTEPVTLNIAPNGQLLGSNVVERLRLVHIEYDAATSKGVRTRLIQGPVVGTLRGTLHFNPLDPRPEFPIRTSNGVLSFHDRAGRTIGSVFANIDQGFAYRMPMPPAPMPVFRFGGYGFISNGDGFFTGTSGMMALNAAISVFPRTLSNMYLLRFNDPDHRFRARLSEAWL